MNKNTELVNIGMGLRLVNARKYIKQLDEAELESGRKCAGNKRNNRIQTILTKIVIVHNK